MNPEDARRRAREIVIACAVRHRGFRSEQVEEALRQGYTFEACEECIAGWRNAMPLDCFGGDHVWAIEEPAPGMTCLCGEVTVPAPPRPTAIARTGLA